MASQADLEFPVSDIWVKYTQERYLTLEQIRYRLQQQNGNRPLPDWKEIEARILKHRKIASIPLISKTLGKHFWFYPADCVQKLVQEIEKLGSQLYTRISMKSVLMDDLLSNAAVEEAVTSAIYEGANTTRARAKTILETGESPKSKDEWMVINNYRALQWVKKNKAHPIDQNLLLTIHGLVSKNTMLGDDANFVGKLRNDSVFIGNHEGVEHKKLEAAIAEIFSGIVSHPRYLPGLVKAILLHYFTAYIHPFFDGNGRTARGIFYFKSVQEDLSFVELLSISAYLQEHGKGYETAFDEVVGNDYDVTYFVKFCLESLHAALAEVSTKVSFLLDIHLLQKPLNLSSEQILLIQKMALHKYRSISIDEYAAELKKAREVARLLLKDLHTKKILIEEKVGRKFAYYVDTQFVRERVSELI